MNTPLSKLEAEINRLRSDLYMARTTIVELMPEQVRQLIQHYHGFKSHDEAYQWEQDLIGKLIAISQPKPAKEMRDYSSFTERAYCPLCGGSAQSIYGTVGFAFPEGLRRHLAGTYNSGRCLVFEAIRGLSRDSVRREEERLAFELQEAQLKQSAGKQKGGRRKTPPSLD
jgi:hypothetical protein